MKRLTFLLLLLAACGGAVPVDIDTKNDACAWCRMTISDIHTAAQLLEPAEEPKLFDDVGCLRDYLAANPKVPQDTLVYVADHRTGAWIPAGQAVYTRVPELATAMGSHLIAHADAAVRAADPAAAGGEPLTAAGVFGPAGLPGLTPGG
jgi:copper chaperone NosL